ncbi:MAG: ribosomal-processing cysteine protease Prp [Lachnospiraceae bacterium]|nr:ribosomal-processing cysteine protease Prp [Lachnospiraceae bacterium]
MIKITIYKNQEDEYVGFQCKGHAAYDQSGHDIVCAAVSILVLNTVNSIEQFTYDKFKGEADDNKTGFIEFMFHSEPSAEAALLIDSMILGLESIRNVYNKDQDYLSISFKEV